MQATSKARASPSLQFNSIAQASTGLQGRLIKCKHCANPGIPSALIQGTLLRAFPRAVLGMLCVCTQQGKVLFARRAELGLLPVSTQGPLTQVSVRAVLGLLLNNSPQGTILYTRQARHGMPLHCSQGILLRTCPRAVQNLEPVAWANFRNTFRTWRRELLQYAAT